MSKKHVQRPKASVLLPVFNAERYLEEAVHSILNQTFTDFECLFLNDGSTDRSAEILESFAKADPRCKIYSWPNQGLTKSLNRGIEVSISDIILRMDADDISRPTRFAKQVEYLDAHPDYVGVGSLALFIDESRLPIREFFGVFSHQNIDAAHISGTGAVICHPAFAVRRDALIKIGGYNEKLQCAQDIDLFLRLAEVGKLENLPEVLLEYRQHFDRVSKHRAVEQILITRAAAIEARNRRGISPFQFQDQQLEMPVDQTRSALHRSWAWSALGASNLMTARKHAWLALLANPFDTANFRLIICVLRGH